MVGHLDLLTTHPPQHAQPKHRKYTETTQISVSIKHKTYNQRKQKCSVIE